MKSRINITIRPDLLRQVDEYRMKNGYSRSLVIFLALRKFFEAVEEGSIK